LFNGAVCITDGVFKWSKVEDESKQEGEKDGGSPEPPKEGCKELLLPKCCKAKKEVEWWE
jgi:hypothetical protein